MDEGTREGSPAVASGGAADEQRSPEEIREEIKETRGELGDTVEELASKADVKAQAKERIADAKARAQQKKDEFTEKAKGASPDSASAGAEQVRRKAQENPLPFAVGGALVAGFVLGRLTARN
jgi:ElaB/YqjD/DUF883 family membrane-anchored ribosome-binding protein